MSYLCTIIIPVFNNWKYTEMCLEQLSALGPQYEIRVVDNASTDNTSEMLWNQIDKFAANPDGPCLNVITSFKNLGFGRGNNKGYKHAQGEYVMFLNNDINIDSDAGDWPNQMIEVAKETGGLVCTKGGELDSNFGFVREGHGLPQSKYWYMSGWCVVGSREVFDKLILNHYSDDQTDEIKEGKAWGPWNEKFFLYYEDGDLTWRARKQEIPITEVKLPGVNHIGRATGKRYNMFVFLKKSHRIFTKIWKNKI